MKSTAKKLIKQLEALGYKCTGFNTKSAMHYGHPNGPAVKILPGISEDLAKVTLRRAREALGQLESSSKRNVAGIRERQVVDRERARKEVERHRTRLAQLQADRAGSLSKDEVRAIELRIKDSEREIAFFSRLMRETPAMSRSRK